MITGHACKHLSLLLLLATASCFPWATEVKAQSTFGARSSHDPGWLVHAPSHSACLGMDKGLWHFGGTEREKSLLDLQLRRPSKGELGWGQLPEEGRAEPGGQWLKPWNLRAKPCLDTEPLLDFFRYVDQLN